MIFWLGLHNLEFVLEVSRQVTVMGVLDILSWEHCIWLIVLVKLFVGLYDVVLDTIAVSIVDSIGTFFPLGAKLDVKVIL